MWRHIRSCTGWLVPYFYPCTRLTKVEQSCNQSASFLILWIRHIKLDSLNGFSCMKSSYLSILDLECSSESNRNALPNERKSTQLQTHTVRLGSHLVRICHEKTWRPVQDRYSSSLHNTLTSTFQTTSPSHLFLHTLRCKSKCTSECPLLFLTRFGKCSREEFTPPSSSWPWAKKHASAWVVSLRRMIRQIRKLLNRAYKAVLLREHMHGASLTSADACFLAKQFCHDLTSWHVFAQCMDVVSIGGANIVILFQVSDHTSRDCFLQETYHWDCIHTWDRIGLSETIIKSQKF